MIGLLIFIAGIAVWFAAKYYVLKKSINKADEELSGIIKDLHANHIVKYAAPDKDLEQLLVTVNQELDAIRQERMVYERKELEFKKQIENISHDLRTPLTSIIGYLKLMESGRLNNEDRESLEIVLKKARSLELLIAQFYDYSRISGDDFLLNIETIDIARILRESVIGYYHMLEEKNLQIALSIPEVPIMVQADAGAVERILANLLQNAYRYAKSCLEIRLEALDGRAVVCFKNDAVNMKPEDAHHLFERFYVQDSSRGQGSTGLGLTIARYLCVKMNGSMRGNVCMTDHCPWLEISFDLKLSVIL